ncbi:DNA cytosine methyltransferase [Reyranella sp. CPCC 100927]|uniref:DNA cytosine methyltransferase n=1 Tax=Reyranella sp. CPCC 100927 TaxID=2599616 RepID=UPI0011B45FA1|nr:DNA cytosine methyltransferase [Reyranella sp. CPCC 100927]TWT06135.1 DNA cytosine methyltransferase [Reyranella sp. CPCC 100927]
MKKFYEFFAGGGMARAGLGSKWRCLFANDADEKKIESYQENWPYGPEPKHENVANLSIEDLPGQADLAWASFPCQDLSQAGNGLGLNGERSGAFWSFWRLMQDLKNAGRAPQIIALENVCGTISSHGGKDFGAIAKAFARAGYRFGAVVIDAKKFVPQSRPRLFFIATNKSQIPRRLTANEPDPQWHTTQLQGAVAKLGRTTRASWVWWRLPTPPARKETFSDLIQSRPTRTIWHSAAETRRLMAMMTSVNRAKVIQAKESRERKVGSIYRRRRPDENGKKHQRAEVRFDDVAGCLRTPVGGSSLQTILVVKGKQSLRSRLLSPREAARLMGLDDNYILPKNNYDAYFLLGDGLVVDVVRFLSKNLLYPLLGTRRPRARQKSGVL